MTNSLQSTPTHPDTTTLSPLQTRLTTLAANAGGFSASEITGLSAAQVRQAAEALVASGHIVRHRVAARRIRYFGTLAQAEAFTKNRVRSVRVGVSGGPRSRASWRADEPGIITPRTKITIAPRLPRSVFRTNTYPQF